VTDTEVGVVVDVDSIAEFQLDGHVDSKPPHSDFIACVTPGDSEYLIEKR
jgi:hypothetical protein